MEIIVRYFIHPLFYFYHKVPPFFKKKKTWNLNLIPPPTSLLKIPPIPSVVCAIKLHNNYRNFHYSSLYSLHFHSSLPCLISGISTPSFINVVIEWGWVSSFLFLRSQPPPFDSRFLAIIGVCIDGHGSF